MDGCSWWLPGAHDRTDRRRKAIASGSHVAKGDVLLELDPQKIDVQIAAAENESLADQANLARAEADVKIGNEANSLAMTTGKNELAFN